MDRPKTEFAHPLDTTEFQLLDDGSALIKRREVDQPFLFLIVLSSVQTSCIDIMVFTLGVPSSSGAQSRVISSIPKDIVDYEVDILPVGTIYELSVLCGL
jgi:hypothetical protein